MALSSSWLDDDEGRLLARLVESLGGGVVLLACADGSREPGFAALAILAVVAAAG